MSGTNQGFLERGFIWVLFADFDLMIPKYPMKMKSFGLTETKLLPFHMIFLKRGGEWV